MVNLIVGIVDIVLALIWGFVDFDRGFYKCAAITGVLVFAPLNFILFFEGV